MLARMKMLRLLARMMSGRQALVTFRYVKGIFKDTAEVLKEHMWARLVAMRKLTVYDAEVIDLHETSRHWSH